MAATLVGFWAQDRMGGVVTHRRTFQFNADGSFEYLQTSRTSGSAQQTLLAREQGTFRVDDRGALVLTPMKGAPTSLAFRVDRDPYVGDMRFVILLPDGSQDIFYRR